MISELPFEVNLIEILQNLIRTYPFLIRFFSFFSFFGEPYIPVVVTCVLYLGKGKKKGLLAGSILLFNSLFNSMVKNAVRRIRPYAVNENIECLQPVDDEYDIYDMDKQGYSFPSGHTGNVFGITCFLDDLLHDRRLTLICLIFSFLVAISRFALGVHYPSDVLSGALLGIMTVRLLLYLDQKISFERFLLVLFLAGLSGVFFCSSDDFYAAYGVLIGLIGVYFFEKRYVSFESTDEPLRIALRCLGAAIIFLLVSNILKVPFPVSFLESGSKISLLYRSFRYALAGFTALGIFPVSFRYLYPILFARKK